ncbi:ABC transporter permease [Dethiothermospora halolimnae]|uniref:ABC transporter permease n=1 Tax=Dethiothermospora halolimnae TaxID=3114390 RepID=UPI003CCB891C
MMLFDIVLETRYTMYNIIICELKKFKRIWILLTLGVFALMYITNIPLNKSSIVNVDDLFTWLNMTMFSYGFLIAINILTAYVFVSEFKNNTMETLIMYRYNRWKIFVGKIIAIVLVAFLLYIVEFIIIIVIGTISFKDTLTTTIIIKHLTLTIKAFAFQMLMITVTGSIALVSRNIVAPSIYIFAQLITSIVFLVNPKVRSFIPFPLPVVSNLMLIENNYSIIKGITILPSTVIIAIVMFIGGLIYGCWHMEKMEVD